MLLLSLNRYVDELEFLAPRLMAMAEALGLKLTVKFYYTGEPLSSKLSLLF